VNKLFTRLVEMPAIRREGEHGGAGPIHFRRLWNSTDFAAPIDFIDFTIIQSGSTIGRHGHEGNEEAYFIVSGSPLMRVENEERRLEKGDVAVVHSGQTHELINDTPVDVEIFVIQVCASGETVPIRVVERFEPDVQYTNGSGNSVLHMHTTRPVHYRVVHPVRPVFDLDELALADFVQTRPALLVVDENVNRLFGERIDSYCGQRLHSVGTVLIDADGQRKEWRQVEQICDEAVRRSLPRNGLIVGVGGGTVLDLAGMAASLFRRGVGYLRIPTTLVGLVDVGVGVKQGINFGENKNILGAFYPPVGAVNDLRFLRTLPQREISCGIAEIIKMGMVCDSGLFELLEAHGPRLLSSRFQAPAKVAYEVAIRAEERMMQQLQPNLFDGDMCRLVDFGHTFSPSIETASNYRIHHGEAVAVDMLMSTIIAAERGICDPDVLARLIRLYRGVALPMTQRVCTAEDFLESIRQTRLHRGGDLNLVVPTNIGSARFIQNVEAAELERVIARSEELTDGGPKARYASACV
jgi:3-dehydroquinate synthetase/mannose-6-phosphate isomerase-like protein (cupin superfamily)